MLLDNLKIKTRARQRTRAQFALGGTGAAGATKSTGRRRFHSQPRRNPERVADYAAATKNPDELSEQARKAIGSQVVKGIRTKTETCRPLRSTRGWRKN